MNPTVRLVSLLSIPFFFINVCNGNEPTDIQNMNKKLLELENEILKLKETNCRHEQKTRELSSLSMAPSVAFRSFLRSTISIASKGQIIVFDQVDLNLGTAYNQHNGVFTAPCNGTYIFSMALGNPGNEPGAMFMVQSDGNNRRVIEFAFVGDTKGWDMGGVTTVAHLTSGNSVWLEGEGHISGSSGDRYHTGFSGALVNKH